MRTQVTVQSAEGAVLAAFDQPRRALCLAFITEQARAWESAKVRRLAHAVLGTAGECTLCQRAGVPCTLSAVLLHWAPGRSWCRFWRLQQGSVQAPLPHHSHMPAPPSTPAPSLSRPWAARGRCS